MKVSKFKNCKTTKKGFLPLMRPVTAAAAFRPSLFPMSAGTRDTTMYTEHLTVLIRVMHLFNRANSIDVLVCSGAGSSSDLKCIIAENFVYICRFLNGRLNFGQYHEHQI